ncbi:MAG: hypothetical protein Q8Q22_00400 [bacterium]|nr:hypothetical protein [bacterium]MDZ4206013.1 hypothetical protein [Patescibacteria group bacterium]
MSISEIVSYDKDGRIERFSLFQKLFLSITIILVAMLSFGVGRLSVVGNREPIRIEYDPELSINDQQQTTNINQTANVINTTGKLAPPSGSDGGVVVSKNGTRYHYPHCAGAKQIKEENKIVFPTPAAAEAAGYTLAANCSPR